MPRTSRAAVTTIAAPVAITISPVAAPPAGSVPCAISVVARLKVLSLVVELTITSYNVTSIEVTYVR